MTPLARAALAAASLTLPLAAAQPAVAQVATGISTCGFYEAVEPGDTLSAISRRCNVPLRRLQQMNPEAGTLRPGDVIRTTVTRPAPPPPDTAPDAGLQEAYERRVRGLWRGAGSDCYGRAGTWDFRQDTVRGNATVFDITRISGSENALRLRLRARDTGDIRIVTLTFPAWNRMALNGSGLAVDLFDCDMADNAEPPGTPAPVPTSPQAAYEETMLGRWRGTGESCGAVVGTWTFGPTTIVANGTSYDIRYISGQPADPRVHVTRHATNENRVFTLSRTGPRSATVFSAEFETDLERCP